MYCQASSSQFNQSLNLPSRIASWLGIIQKERSTLRCQINESTRLAFSDFFSTLHCFSRIFFIRPIHLWIFDKLFPTLLVYLSLLIYEIYSKYPPYLFIWSYSFIWHLRVISNSLETTYILFELPYSWGCHLDDKRTEQNIYQLLHEMSAADSSSCCRQN